MLKNCCTCGNSFFDPSVNDLECESKDITEQELQKYFTEGKENCPHWIEQKREQKVLTLEQTKRMFEAIESTI
jgi:hypothetical protein